MTNTRRRDHEHLPHQVYVLRDRAGTVLYVGVTSALKQRLATHKRTQPWWSDVDPGQTTATPPAPWEDAITAEERFIRTLRPLHNKRRSNGSPYVRLGVRDEVIADREKRPRPEPTAEDHERVARIFEAAMFASNP